MPRLLLADHHELFRAALREILETEQDLQVVGETVPGSELLTHVEVLRPDVLLLDLPTPPPAGVEILQHLTRRQPDLRILVLSEHPEDRFAVFCLRAGADGYMTKYSAAQDLVEAIRRVAAGRKYVSPPLAEQLATDLAQGVPDGPPHESLSRREHEVLQRLAQAKTVSDIARDLGLSVKTVSTYRVRTMEKLGVRNNAEAMLYALRHGLVESQRTRRHPPPVGDKENP